MKRQEIVLDPHEKNILLGVFSTDVFEWGRSSLPVFTYGTFDAVIDGDVDFNNIMDTVKRAAEKASRIVFILDDVHFPIDVDRSVTCGELKLICDNDELFNKTIFVKGENVITFDKNLVI